jgi:MarR family transcriptional regulator, lower aerobic nicotinate degradation pathway regulator
MHSADDEITFVLHGLRRLVHELRVTSHTAERDLDLTGAQLFVLRELAADSNISIRELSERTVTDPSSASVVVSRLVERGLVSRQRDPKDRRKSVLSVSARGHKLLARAPEPYQAKLIERLRALPASQLRQLRLGLAALLDGSVQPRGAAPMFFEPPTRKPSPGKPRVKTT